MRIPFLAMAAALLVAPATVQAATAFGTFTVQVVVVGTCRIDAAQILPQVARGSDLVLCGASRVRAIARLVPGGPLIVEF